MVGLSAASLSCRVAGMGIEPLPVARTNVRTMYMLSHFRRCPTSGGVVSFLSSVVPVVHSFAFSFSLFLSVYIVSADELPCRPLESYAPAGEQAVLMFSAWLRSCLSCLWSQVDLEREGNGQAMQKKGQYCSCS